MRLRKLWAGISRFLRWTPRIVGALAGISALVWNIVLYWGDLEVEFSNYWIYSRKVERIAGTKGCAIFDTITLPLTFYNTGGFARVVRMLRLEIWVNDQFHDLFQANREYEVFDQQEVIRWEVKNFYINSVVLGHGSIVKIVEFYPTFWTSRTQFSLEPQTIYTLKLFMSPRLGGTGVMAAGTDWPLVRDRWIYMGSLIIKTGDVHTLSVDPALCEDQVDSITY